MSKHSLNPRACLLALVALPGLTPAQDFPTPGSSMVQRITPAPLVRQNWMVGDQERWGCWRTNTQPGTKKGSRGFSISIPTTPLPIPQIDPSRHPVGPSKGGTNILNSGGPGFVDDPLPDDAHVAGIGIQHSDDLVVAIWLIYQNHNGEYHVPARFASQPDDATKLGQTQGRYEELKLVAGETIHSIRVRTGVGVDQVQLLSSKGRSWTFGGSGGTDEITLTIPANHEVVGFFGNNSRTLNRLGVLTRPVNPGR